MASFVASRSFLGPLHLRVSAPAASPIVISGLLGLILFLCLFGMSVVDTSNTRWLYASDGDLAQHQLGWEFYRESPWKFPLGSTQNLL